MPDDLLNKVREQMLKAGLPATGAIPFVPKLGRNKKGETVIEKARISHGPKIGKRGYVDSQERIWLKDRAHADVPDHWDVQVDAGATYFRVDMNGNLLP